MSSFSILPPRSNLPPLVSSCDHLLLGEPPVRRQGGILSSIDARQLALAESQLNRQKDDAWTFGSSWIVPMGCLSTQMDESEEESAQEETPLRGSANLPQQHTDGEFDTSQAVDLDQSIEDADENEDIDYIEMSGYEE